MAPSTMKKGPMAVNLSEMSHAVDVVPTLAPRTTPKSSDVRIPASTSAMVRATTALLD